MTVAPDAQHPDFETEQDFLHHAAACLSAMRDAAAGASNAGADKKAAAALERLREKQLERMRDPETIIFGRLQFEEGDDFRIGPQGIWGDGNVIVVNWAAPAANPYYEATPDDPAGLALRRRLRTERTQLLGIADEWFGTAAVEPTLGDILLDELTRDRTSEMRQIAATIQADQYKIIARPFVSPTVVQGGPGTGKTVVGLHRAALLLYRHRTELAARRVLVVGPNPVFMRYIAYVLPSLGESAADQVAVTNLVEVRADERDDALVARIKGEATMAEVIRRAVVDRVRPPSEDIEVSANGIAFSLPAERVTELIGGYDASTDSYSDARMRFRAALRRLAEETYRATYTGSHPGRVPTALPSNIPELDRAMDRIWPSLTATELIRQLLASEERIERAAAGVLTDVHKRLLYRRPVEKIEDVRWTTSDLPLIDEAQALMQPTARRYGHVILDEAQDLTPMQLRMVGRRISGGSVTVLGDLAQATGLWSYSTWDEVVEHLGVEDGGEVVELTYAYRVPREIMEMALPVLQLTAPSITPPIPFRDSGDEPDLVPAPRDSRTTEAVNRSETAHASGGTVAIIGPRSLIPVLRLELEMRGVAFGDADRDELAPTVELLDPTASKGLEFDHVIVVEPGAIIREAEGQGQRDLYVALTRATRTVTCIHAEPLPWPLSDWQGAAETVTRDTVEPEQRDGDMRIELPAPPSTPRPTITVDEAFSIARKRGLSFDQAIARALIALRRGDSEQAVAGAVLDETAADGDLVEKVLRASEPPPPRMDGDQ